MADLSNLNLVVGVSAPILSILLGMNLFFIRRLVDRIDRMEKTVQEKLPVHQNELKNMNEKINEMERELRQMARDFRDVANLRERVAVIEAMTKKPRPQK